MNWEPGELPTGWVRATTLWVTNPGYTFGSWAALSPAPELCTGYDALDCNLVLVRFHHDERAKVIKWLRWYFDCETTIPQDKFIDVYRAIR